MPPSCWRLLCVYMSRQTSPGSHQQVSPQHLLLSKWQFKLGSCPFSCSHKPVQPELVTSQPKSTADFSSVEDKCLVWWVILLSPTAPPSRKPLASGPCIQHLSTLTFLIITLVRAAVVSLPFNFVLKYNINKYNCTNPKDSSLNDLRVSAHQDPHSSSGNRTFQSPEID